MEKTNFLYYDRLMIEYKETKHSLVYKANSDLSLYSAGYEECTPGYSYGPTLRSYQLIHFVLNGEGEFRINEHVFHLKAGDAFLIPAGKITYYEASLTSHYFEGNSILLHIISMLFSDVDFHEADTNKLSIIDEIKFYFDINYAENLKLKDVADYFGIHQNYLTRAFHEKFGISPKKYLLQLKFKKAARLLATTQLPVSIISNSLGFEDQLAFSRTFKKFYNVSPTDYRSHLKP